MERFKGIDVLALSRRLKRAFDIVELTNLSNSLIENILADVDTLSERFRWVKDLRDNEEFKIIIDIDDDNDDENDIGNGNDKERNIENNKNNAKLHKFSPEDFLPLTHLFQDLLTEIGNQRKTFNELQLTYVRKVEDTRRKAEEEFDRSMGYRDYDEIIERGQRDKANQNNEGVFGTFSRVFGISPLTSQLRYHNKRMSDDYLHERDTSVDSIDTFAEDSYFVDRNYDSYSNVQNTVRSTTTTKQRERNESTDGGSHRKSVWSFFGSSG